MATNVLMPQLGESITEGTIIRWNKKVGESVDRDEPLFEISTDKVDAEIPSPAAGVVAEIRVAEGETVPVDSVVARISGSGETETEGATPVGGATPTVESAAVDGRAPATARGTEPSSRTPTQSSPVVRRLAREHGVDLSTLRGSGAGGRVTKQDVLDAVAVRSERATGPAEGGEGDRVEPMSVMRRRIAEHMLASRRTSAHVHTVFDVDFSRVEELRRAHRDDFEAAGTKLTYLTFVGKAVVDALGEVDVVNASVREDDVVYHRDVNLGIAVALDWGLIVPVVKRAQAKSLVELSRDIADLSTRAREKKLSPDDVAGGTFTITNPGVFGSILGLPIINQPQVAILCMGAVEKRPAVVGDEVVAQTRSYLTLAFDHRIIDGAVADRFMAIVKQGLEQFDETLLRSGV